MAAIWSVVFGFIIKKITGSLKAALIVAVVVFSHWILDYVTHIPDLPLWFGETKVGLGLWKSAWATFVLETGIFISGVFLYLKSFPQSTRKKEMTFWLLIAFLFTVYLLHVFGPKPPETTSSYLVAAPAFALWIIVLWAHYADKKLF